MNTGVAAESMDYQNRFHTELIVLLGEFDGAGFADHVDLDSTWVLHGRLDLGSDVTGQLDGAEVINRLRPDKNPDFAAGADSVGFLDAGEAVGDILQVAHPVTKVLGTDVAGARPGGADCVDGADDERFDGRGFDVVVVLFGSQGDFFGRAVLA